MMHSRLISALFCVYTASGCHAAVHVESSPVVKVNAVSEDAKLGFRVAGNAFRDHDKTVRLLGVNYSGAESSCIKGTGIFDGPVDDALITPMLAWKVNTVRIPLNEQCWLGGAGLDPKYSGQPYRDAISSLVAAIRKHDLYVILDLHWAAPNSILANRQQPMADADHAPLFWKSVATLFASDESVIFDIYNEPFLDAKAVADGTDPWTCLVHGCLVNLAERTPKELISTYKSAGTQALVDTIRAAGSQNVILVPGLSYTSDLSKWLSHQPIDPLHNFAATAHVYKDSGCNDAECWNEFYRGVTEHVPLVTGEIGEKDCAHAFIDSYMSWADELGVSYLGWTWNTWDCKKGPALITKYDGTPTAFGKGLMTHLQSR